MHFLDRFSFSVEGNLDPDGLMPPGDTYAVSPIQLSYSPFSMSAVYGAPPVPVSLKFKSPGKEENGNHKLHAEHIRLLKSGWGRVEYLKPPCTKSLKLPISVN